MVSKVILRIALAIVLAVVIGSWISVGVALVGNARFHEQQAAQYEPLVRQLPLPPQKCQTAACEQAIQARNRQIAETADANSYWIAFHSWLISTGGVLIVPLTVVLAMVGVRRQRSQARRHLLEGQSG